MNLHKVEVKRCVCNVTNERRRRQLLRRHEVGRTDRDNGHKNGVIASGRERRRRLWLNDHFIIAMGGHPDIGLVSHRKDDRMYNKRRRELRKHLPELKQHLDKMKSDGLDSSICYRALSAFSLQLTDPSVRVPMHVLLRGEDLLRREVLKSQEAKGWIVEAVWRSSGFRLAVAKKLDETVSEHGMPPSAPEGYSASRMEEHIFARSKTKDEYLEFAARIMLFLRESTCVGSHGKEDKIVREKVQKRPSISEAEEKADSVTFGIKKRKEESDTNLVKITG